MKKRWLSLLLALVLVFLTVPVSAVAAGRATLRYGSKGDDVKELQHMLNVVEKSNLTEDGVFGAKTRTAVRNFQSKNGLTVDGIVGTKTWTKLEEQYNAIIVSQNTRNQPTQGTKTTLTFSDLSTPGTLTEGGSGHVSGRITSSSSPIISVTAQICTSSDAVVASASSSGFSVQSYGDINGSKIDNDLTTKLKALSAGTYYIRYTAKTKDGTSASGQTATFQVVAKAPTQQTTDTSQTQTGTTQTVTTAKTTLTFTGLTTPGNIKEREGGHVSGKIISNNSPITSVTAEIYSSSGEKMATVSSGGFSVKSYGDFKGSKIDTGLNTKLKALSAGTYYINYTAKAKDGTTASEQTGTFQVLLNLTKYRIKDIQRYLNFIYDLGLDADGVLGTTTKNAVKRFQTENDLPANGTVDAQTLDLLIARFREALEKYPNKETATRLAFAAKNLNDVHGCVQFQNTSGDGICTSCATVTLLRRKQFLDGKELTFNIGDVRMSYGGKRADIDKGIYTPGFSWDNRTWTDEYTVQNGSNSSYKTKEDTSKLSSNSLTAAQNRVIELLKSHPEGVVLYNKAKASDGKYYWHAIVVTDYTNGQFYAIDSVNTNNHGTYSYRKPLTKTWMYETRCGGSMTTLFCGATVWYVV